MASGKPTTEQDRQVALRAWSERVRILKRWEIENYLFDEEILSALCAANGHNFDVATYNSLVKNIVDEDVKALAKQLKAACGIDVNFSTEKFKLGLAAVIHPKMAVYQELVECIFERK